MIRFSCPKCDTSLKSADDKAGTKTTCPRCGERLLVPAESEPEKKSGATSKGTAKTAVVPKKGAKAKSSREKEEKKSSPVLMIGIAVIALAVAGGGAAVFLMSSNKPDQAKAPEATAAAPQPAPPLQVAAAKNPTSNPAGRPTSAAAPALKPTDAPKPAVENKITATPVEKSDVVSEAASLQGDEIYKKVLKSASWVVTSRKTQRGDLESVGGETGTGSLVDRQNKLILTNYHVIRKSETGRLVVFFPEYKKGELVVDRGPLLERALLRGDGIPSWVEYKDEKRDLALVKLGGEIPEGIQPIRLSKNSAKPGQRVHSLGNPGASSALWVYTFGTVRGFPHHRKWLAGSKDDLLDLEAKVIETQSPTNPGDSGGPLVNERAELIAVTQGGAGGGAQQISTFIDVSEVRHVLAAYYKSKELTPPPDTAPKPTESTDIPTLVKALQGPDAAGRARAAELLGQIGSEAKAAVPPLVKLLKDKDEGVRKNSAQALEQIGSLTQADVPAVIEVMKDANSDIRIAAINAVKQMGTEADSAIPGLIEALRDSVPAVRLQATKALAVMGPVANSSIAPLAKVLQEDKIADVRVAAVLALSKMGPEARAALPALEAALKDPDLDVRLGILSALETLGPDAKAVVPLLIKSLKEKNRDYRIGIIKVFGAVGPDATPAIPTLIKFFEDKDLRDESARSLGKIGKNAVKPLTSLLNPRVNSDIRLIAVFALGEIGPDAKAVLDTLKYIARTDRVPQIRDAAAEATKKIQPAK